MSKVTFRADDDLVAAVEDLDASKSEVMRNALRAYLTTHAAADDVPVESVNTPVRGAATDAQKDVNVTIRVSSPSAVEEVRTTPASGGRADAEEPGDDGETDAEHADTSATGDESVCSQCSAGRSCQPTRLLSELRWEGEPSRVLRVRRRDPGGLGVLSAVWPPNGVRGRPRQRIVRHLFTPPLIIYSKLLCVLVRETVVLHRTTGLRCPLASERPCKTRRREAGSVLPTRGYNNGACDTPDSGTTDRRGGTDGRTREVP
nr:orf1 [Halobacterium salinarum]